VRLHEDYLTYRRFFEFSEKKVQDIIDLEPSNDIYYYTIENSCPDAGSPTQQALDFLKGIRTNIIVMNPQTVGEIKYWCRTYLEATKRFQIFFVLGMTATTFFVLTIKPFDNTILIFILMCILAVSGFFPKAQSLDRIMDSSYLSRRHYHVYTFFPPDVKNPEGVYKCVCGAKLDSSTDEKQEGAPISSLSREEEVETARKMENDKQALEAAIFRLSVSINEVLNIGDKLADKLATGEFRSKDIVDNFEYEEGFMEEYEQLERILKLIARIKLFNDRNTVLRAKLKSNTLRSEQRELLNAELEKNTKYIVTLCGKIHFNKKQIHRFISRLRDYAEEVERPENVIAQYEKETGLTLTQMEELWAKMK
jgi:hypothetical protein